MQRAEIISAEGYKEWIGPILHRFLVLELRRSSRKPIWLRIDRRMAQGVGTFRFIRALATTPANDTVSMHQAPTKLWSINQCLHP